MDIKKTDDLTTITFYDDEIGLSAKQTYYLLIQEISTNPDAVSGSFIFDAPNGVELEVTIART